MAYNSRDLKVISIIQIVLSVIFFILGMVDGFEVRFLYSSSTFTPCWISALVSIHRVLMSILEQIFVDPFFDVKIKLAGKKIALPLFIN